MTLLPFAADGRRGPRLAGLTLMLALLGGCASLPSSGPTAADIAAASHDRAAPLGFEILDVTPDVVARLHRLPPQPALGALASLPAPNGVDAIGPGDVLQISVFEIGAALFSGRSSAVTVGATVATPPSAAGEALPPVTVATDGSVLLPYVGRILAAGFTTQELAAHIQAGLAGKSQAPQVMVSISSDLANSVMVTGEVKKPGRIVLTPARERVSDAIALAGGLADPVPDSMVRLNRAGASLVLPMADLQTGASEDIALQPQDRVEVILHPRSFTVFGATGKVQEIPFQSPRVSLAEALARAGGPSEQQADPSAVFIFRYEPSGPDGAPEPGAKPVAYRLNLYQAQSYFLAQAFEMQTRDVVYIPNARSNQPVKLLQILNLFFQPIYTGKVLAQ